MSKPDYEAIEQRLHSIGSLYGLLALPHDTQVLLARCRELEAALESAEASSPSPPTAEEWERGFTTDLQGLLEAHPAASPFIENAIYHHEGAIRAAEAAAREEVWEAARNIVSLHAHNCGGCRSSCATNIHEEMIRAERDRTSSLPDVHGESREQPGPPPLQGAPDAEGGRLAIRRRTRGRRRG